MVTPFRLTNFSKTSGAASSPRATTCRCTSRVCGGSLGEDRIVTRNGGYALDVPADALDAHRFERLADAGHVALQEGNAADAARRPPRRALRCWRGAPLVEFVEDGFARPVITRLEESRLAALEDRADADLLLGRHTELIGELEACVREHPLRERLWAQLMTALYRAGRQGDALRAYQRARGRCSPTSSASTPGPSCASWSTRCSSRIRRSVRRVLLALTAPRRRTCRASASALHRAHHEIEATRELLEEHRVVTIVGPGGVGKTRLATEIGHRQLPTYHDGVWLADLAPVGDPADVAAAIGSALGVEVEHGPGAAATMLERLSEYLYGRELLLLLDNCEHVVAEVARIVAELVARNGRLHVLATSRESLAIAGEALWPLAPLALDDAIELFVVRARAVAPNFDLDDDFDAVRTICAQLDGLPLAIELAAARMRALAPDDLLTRLDDRFRLLTAGSRAAPPRQQTLARGDRLELRAAVRAGAPRVRPGVGVRGRVLADRGGSRVQRTRCRSGRRGRITRAARRQVADCDLRRPHGAGIPPAANARAVRQ